MDQVQMIQGARNNVWLLTAAVLRQRQVHIEPGVKRMEDSSELQSWMITMAMAANSKANLCCLALTAYKGDLSNDL